MHSSRMRTACSSSCQLGGGVASVHAGIHTPWVWAWRSPPRPAARHAGRPPARHAGRPPPGDLLHGMLGYHLQCMLGYHPPVNRMTDRCKNITLSQTSFAGGNNILQILKNSIRKNSSENSFTVLFIFPHSGTKG